MTQEQKRIKIAEKVGWKFHPLTEHLYSEQEKADAIMCWVRPGNDPWQMECVPDYFNDLNAMHEAEKVAGFMSDDFQGRKLKRTWFRHMGSNQNIWFATATQRAEAFGKTLNLW